MAVSVCPALNPESSIENSQCRTWTGNSPVAFECMDWTSSELSCWFPRHHHLASREVWHEKNRSNLGLNSLVFYRTIYIIHCLTNIKRRS